MYENMNRKKRDRGTVLAFPNVRTVPLSAYEADYHTELEKLQYNHVEGIATSEILNTEKQLTFSTISNLKELHELERNPSIKD